MIKEQPMLLEKPFKPGFYVSGLINNRFQIFENDYREFIVSDVVDQVVVAGLSGRVPAFKTLAGAEAFANGKVVVETQKATKEPKEAKEPKAPKTPKAPKLSVVGMIMDLLKTTDLSDEDIWARVSAAFPDSTSYSLGSVRRRRKLI